MRSGWQSPYQLLIREVAGNLEGLDGVGARRCDGVRAGGGGLCLCHRTTGHGGAHRCTCGGEWSERPVPPRAANNWCAADAVPESVPLCDQELVAQLV